jgi:hypothetical protein
MKTDFMQMDGCDPILKALLFWLEDSTGLEFTETSTYRKDDDGVHGTWPYRGKDLRCRDEAIGEAIKDYINASWTYDVERPQLKCCVLHGEGSNLHLHIQVHSRTVFKG